MGRKIKNDPKIIELYNSGLSSRQVAEKLNLHKAGPEYTIPKHKRCQRKVYMKDYMKRYRASKT